MNTIARARSPITSLKISLRSKKSNREQQLPCDKMNCAEVWLTVSSDFSGAQDWYTSGTLSLQFHTKPTVRFKLSLSTRQSSRSTIMQTEIHSLCQRRCQYLSSSQFFVRPTPSSHYPLYCLRRFKEQLPIQSVQRHFLRQKAHALPGFFSPVGSSAGEGNWAGFFGQKVTSCT